MLFYLFFTIGFQDLNVNFFQFAITFFQFYEKIFLMVFIWVFNLYSSLECNFGTSKIFIFNLLSVNGFNFYFCTLISDAYSLGGWFLGANCWWSGIGISY